MAAALLPFVYEERLTGALFGGAFAREGRAQPQLALGELLLRRRRLSLLLADEGDATQRARLAEIAAQHEAVCREWSVHYRRKLNAELDWRARRLRAFLQDQREEGGAMAGFGAEAGRRTLAQELWRELVAREYAEDAKRARRELAAIDGQLRPLTRPAPFRWDAHLRPAYPKDEYWWLYATARDGPSRPQERRARDPQDRPSRPQEARDGTSRPQEARASDPQDRPSRT